MPGHPTVIKGTAKSGLGAQDQANFEFRLHQYGNLDGADAGGGFDDICPNVGPIFNPLAEYLWWD